MFGPPSQKKLDKRMMDAIGNGNLEKLKTAVEAGANVQGAKGYYATPVYSAVAHGQGASLGFLLGKGASVEPATDNGYYVPFIRAAEMGDLKILDMLLQADADINVRDYKGRTALHIAAMNGDGKVARWLLDKHADVSTTDYQMNTPADLAEKEYPRIADLIRGKDPVSNAAAEGWRMTGANEAALVSDKSALGYRVTETFNFSARLYSRIARNLETNAESQSVLPFSALEDGNLIEQAKKAFLGMGGRLPDEPASENGKAFLKPLRGTPEAKP